MVDYTIAEEYTLPSKGKIYDKAVDPVFKLRSMTTQDEMKRLGHSDREYKLLAEVIDDCTLTKNGISSYDMCLADYEFLMHKLRVVTYGPNYKTQSICPHCRALNDNVINLDELKIIPYTDEIKENLEFDLPVTKKHIKLRIQTPRLIDDAAQQVKEQGSRIGKDSDSNLLFTLLSLIETVDNQELDVVKREQFIKSLPMRDTNKIIKKAGKIIDCFGIDKKVQLKCEKCGLAYTSSFRITSEFFGPTEDD